MTRKYDTEGPTLRVRLGYAEKEVERLTTALAAPPALPAGEGGR